MENKVKHFLKSSESYIAFALILLGALLTTGVVADGSTAARIIGGVLEVAGFLGYTVARVSLKNTERKATALETQALKALEVAKVTARDPS